MIFLWGSRNKVLEVYSDENFKCEKCNSNNLIYSVSQNYFHLFWIPIVPNYKFVSSYCPDCIESREIVYSETGARLKKQTRTPIYMYSLLIVFGGLLLYGIFNSISYYSKQKEFIKDPIKEDVYTVKFKDDKKQDAYSFVKIVAVTKDSIFLVLSDTYFNQDISYLKSGVSFMKDTISKSRDELINMYSADNIVTIYRSDGSKNK